MLQYTPMSAEASSTLAAFTSPIAMMFGDFGAEHAGTRRMLERFPDAYHDWRPHERSSTIAELATHIADLPNRGVVILTTDSIDFGVQRPLATVGTAAELLAMHDANVDAQNRALAGADLAALSKEWTIRHGEQVDMRGPKYQLIRTTMMSHLIHHRAQLSVYYRLLGVSVPGMYGPSADDRAGRK
jgi:uncharacterized damage-inducible protein DinB